MIPIILWNWLKNNFNLFLLLMATVCLALALGGVIRGATWSLLMPVTMAAVLCGWWFGRSRLNGRQAAGGLAVFGITGIFISVTGLVVPLGNLALAAVSTVTQSIPWMYDRTPVNFGPLIANWTDFIDRFAAVLSRLGEWIGVLGAGKTATDPVVTGLAWSMLLWLVGVWSGWQLCRHHQALRALAPGGLVLSLVLDYTSGKIIPLVFYLAILLTLIAVSRYGGLRVGWQRRGLDYSESIASDSTLVMIPLIILLVGLAAITPSFSWQDLVERLQKTNRYGDDRVAESLGLDAPPNAATSHAYRPADLPRQHLLGLPPEQLKELVLIVSTGELPPIPNVDIPITVNRYYWRSITYDVYSGAGWSSSRAQNTPLPANATLMEIPTGYRIVHQQMDVISNQDGRLYWTGTLVQADVDLEIAWRLSPPSEPSPVHNGDMLGALITPNEYNVVSIVPLVSAKQLRAAGSDYPTEVTERYLRLPETIPERVLALARELTGTAPTPYDRALAIQTNLRKFPYTLEVEPPPPGQDVVDYFLFTLKKGYCDYYASAMVVLARAAGVPARIVVGYASGTYNATSAQYEVRQENVHSWPEIYFPGIGWVEFEPTASQPEISHPGGNDASLSDIESAHLDLTATWLKEQWRWLVTTITGQVLLMLASLAVIAAIWQAGEIWLLHLMPAQRVIQTLYTRLEKNSARLLPNLSRGHTPHELQAALVIWLVEKRSPLPRSALNAASRKIERIVSLYVAQVFSQQKPVRSQVREGIKAWARLQWMIRVAGKFK